VPALPARQPRAPAPASGTRTTGRESHIVARLPPAARAAAAGCARRAAGRDESPCRSMRLAGNRESARQTARSGRSRSAGGRARTRVVDAARPATRSSRARAPCGAGRRGRCGDRSPAPPRVPRARRASRRDGRLQMRDRDRPSIRSGCCRPEHPGNAATCPAGRCGPRLRATAGSSRPSSRTLRT